MRRQRADRQTDRQTDKQSIGLRVRRMVHPGKALAAVGDELQLPLLRRQWRQAHILGPREFIRGRARGRARRRARRGARGRAMWLFMREGTQVAPPADPLGIKEEHAYRAAIPSQRHAHFGLGGRRGGASRGHPAMHLLGRGGGRRLLGERFDGDGKGGSGGKHPGPGQTHGHRRSCCRSGRERRDLIVAPASDEGKIGLLDGAAQRLAVREGQGHT
jgi:hypothetical protein